MSELITGPNLDEALRQAQSLVNGKAGPRKQSSTASGKGIPRPLQEDKLSQRFELVPAYLFYVEISGLVVALFSSVSEISMERDVETVREGGKNDHPYSFPGMAHYGNITLTRGLTVSRELIDWFMAGIYDFNVRRYNLTIYQGAPGMNEDGTKNEQAEKDGIGFIKQWDIFNAYPKRWQLSDLSVKDTEAVAIETLELAHEGIRLAARGG